MHIIEKLETIKKRTEKEQVLFSAYMEGERNLFIGLKLAYDPLISFGISKIAFIEDDDDIDDFSFDDFLVLANKLQTRQLAGNAARNAINDAANKCNVKTWNLFYRRILLKDMRIGIEAKTINKVLNKIPDSDEFKIPLFGIQLAQDAKKLSGIKLVDYKLDGVRLIAILDKTNGVSLFFRTGKQTENFPAIKQSLENLLHELPGSIVLDGEIVDRDFQTLMTQITRKEYNTNNSRFAVFDIIPLQDFKNGYCGITQEKRHEALSELQTSGLLSKHCQNKVYVIPKTWMDMADKDKFNEYNKMAIDAGYEGIMIKNPNAPYESKDHLIG